MQHKYKVGDVCMIVAREWHGFPINSLVRIVDLADATRYIAISINGPRWTQILSDKSLALPSKFGNQF